MTVTADAHGNPTSGPAEAVARYDDAVDRLLRLRDEVVPAATGLVADEPALPMAQVLWAYLLLSSTDEADVPGARQALAALDGLALGAREAAHRAVVAAWAAGDWHGAARLLDDLLVRWPADLLALMLGHQLDFFLGDAANLRDRVGRSLGSVDPAHPHHGLVRGMYAFGLEESGHYAAAEEHGLAAVERNPDDVWGIHAVVHTYEMEGRVDQGLRFLAGHEGDWLAGNLFVVHLAWHRALYLLEAGRPDEALATYDAHVHHAGSPGVPLELLDASALLWRLLLDGVDTGDRFPAVADAWWARVGDAGPDAGGVAAGSWYVFNDAHAVMALAGAGRLADAHRVVDRLAAGVADAAAGAGDSSNLRMTAEAGLPAARALLAYAEGRHDDAVDALLPARATLHRFGGSHAQRDAFERTLLESALRAGRLDLARALVAERLARRPTSVYALVRHADLLRRQGRPDAAATVEAQAAAHATHFATALSP